MITVREQMLADIADERAISLANARMQKSLFDACTAATADAAEVKSAVEWYEEGGMTKGEFWRKMRELAESKLR